jgi:DNA-binding MarR family transcriptional regulator
VGRGYDALAVEGVLAFPGPASLLWPGLMSNRVGEVTLAQSQIPALRSAHGSMRAGTLAGRSGVNPPTLSRTPDRLVKGRWVRRVANPDCRGAVLLELIPKGCRLLTDVTATSPRLRCDPDAGAGPTTFKSARGVGAFSSAAGEDTDADLLAHMLEGSRDDPDPWACVTGRSGSFRRDRRPFFSALRPGDSRRSRDRRGRMRGRTNACSEGALESLKIRSAEPPLSSRLLDGRPAHSGSILAPRSAWAKLLLSIGLSPKVCHRLPRCGVAPLINHT